MFSDLNPASDRDIWVMTAASGDVRPLLNSKFREEMAALSPDSRWLAYVSNQSGRDEVYIQGFDRADGRVQISTNGGTGPIWSHNGRELFYAEGQSMMAVDLQLTGAPQAGRPRVLFEGPHVWERTRDYSITPDGKRFVVVRYAEGYATTATLRVILNWPQATGRDD